MNMQRRKLLAAAGGELNTLAAEAAIIRDKLIELAEDIEALALSEQEAFDNLPESLQQGAKGETAEAAMAALSEAQGALEGMADSINDDAFDEILNLLATAANGE